MWQMDVEMEPVLALDFDIKDILLSIGRIIVFQTYLSCKALWDYIMPIFIVLAPLDYYYFFLNFLYSIHLNHS